MLRAMLRSLAAQVMLCPGERLARVGFAGAAGPEAWGAQPDSAPEVSFPSRRAELTPGSAPASALCRAPEAEPRSVTPLQTQLSPGL